MDIDDMGEGRTVDPRLGPDDRSVFIDLDSHGPALGDIHEVLGNLQREGARVLAFDQRPSIMRIVVARDDEARVRTELFGNVGFSTADGRPGGTEAHGLPAVDGPDGWYQVDLEALPDDLTAVVDDLWQAGADVVWYPRPGDGPYDRGRPWPCRVLVAPAHLERVAAELDDAFGPAGAPVAGDEADDAAWVELDLGDVRVVDVELVAGNLLGDGVDVDVVTDEDDDRAVRTCLIVYPTADEDAVLDALAAAGLISAFDRDRLSSL
ncbi:MAG: hypothetical protein KF906_11175 [Actinobacteria bacterium]|nr:hypothetical protein [Actinomycetota bacterium]